MSLKDSTEYRSLMENWEERKKDLYQKFKEMSLSGSDKQIANEARKLVCEFRAIDDAQEELEKAFSD